MIEAELRKATDADRQQLLEVWLLSVRATHAFITESEIARLTPLVADYVQSAETEFHVAVNHDQIVLGFMGMKGQELESLFLRPDVLRQGLGRRMVKFAQSMHDRLTADVNEQNRAATDFYRACGFRVTGRSEFDAQGHPHPLLHLEWCTTTEP